MNQGLIRKSRAPTTVYRPVSVVLKFEAPAVAVTASLIWQPQALPIAMRI